MKGYPRSDFVHWLVSDMPMDTENVRLLGKTRSDRRKVGTTRLTHLRHRAHDNGLARHQPDP
jgi:hypothetical protein